MAAFADFAPKQPAMDTCAEVLLDVIQSCLHARSSEWLFLRELRVGSGSRLASGQRLDAFALNCLAYTSMKRICYEVKTSRADYLCELKQPLKRRLGLRYSNEFYFVTPPALLSISELPIECGLIEVGTFPEEDRGFTAQQKAVVHFDAVRSVYCRQTVPAPWRETPGPTWQFVASMMRNHQKAVHNQPIVQPKQQKLEFLK